VLLAERTLTLVHRLLFFSHYLLLLNFRVDCYFGGFCYLRLVKGILEAALVDVGLIGGLTLGPWHGFGTGFICEGLWGLWNEVVHLPQLALFFVFFFLDLLVVHLEVINGRGSFFYLASTPGDVVRQIFVETFAFFSHNWHLFLYRVTSLFSVSALIMVRLELLKNLAWFRNGSLQSLRLNCYSLALLEIFILLFQLVRKNLSFLEDVSGLFGSLDIILIIGDIICKLPPGILGLPDDLWSFLRGYFCQLVGWSIRQGNPSIPPILLEEPWLDWIRIAHTHLV